MNPAPASGIAPQVSPAPHPLAGAGSPSTDQWQRRLLPVMVAMVAVVTVFFLLASLFQLYSIHNRIEASPVLELGPALALLESAAPGAERDPQTTLDFARWKTLAILEGHTLQRRYHQANVLLMARVWVRYLGFVTGMILSLVGAVFILGKLREPVTRMEAQGQGFSGSLATSSPGIVLAVLGTGLMLATILTHNQIDVSDAPPYTADPSFLASRAVARRAPRDVSNLAADAEPSGQSRQGGSEAGSPAKVGDLLDEIDRRLGSGGAAAGTPGAQ